MYSSYTLVAATGTYVFVCVCVDCVDCVDCVCVWIVCYREFVCGVHHGRFTITITPTTRTTQMASRPVAKRQELVQLMQMQAEGNNTEGLLDAVLCGVAFHHSGLHPEERGLVERVGELVEGEKKKRGSNVLQQVYMMCI